MTYFNKTSIQHAALKSHKIKQNVVCPKKELKRFMSPSKTQLEMHVMVQRLAQGQSSQFSTV